MSSQIESISASLRSLKQAQSRAARLRYAEWMTNRQRRGLGRRMKGRRHSLSKPLVVRLASYPPRYANLSKTLVNLLSQSLLPDQVVLAVYEGDLDKLPRQVTELCEFGLSIRSSPDWRSYNKIIPQLHETPDAFILTADDDVYYDSEWLQRVVLSYMRGPPGIVAHRGHLMTFDKTGLLRPYNEWRFDVVETGLNKHVFATGVGGILYPPGSLDAGVSDSSCFLRCCPTADDIWLHWMARRAGTLTRTTAKRFVQVQWTNPIETGLTRINWDGGNDRQIGLMMKEFGDVTK